MIPSVTPHATATAASRQARSRTRSRSERASSRPPSAATSSALDQSRSPVIWAGVTWLNIRAARPAPTWTERMPVSTSAEDGTVFPARLRGPTRLPMPPSLAPPSRVARRSLLNPGGAAPLRLAAIPGYSQPNVRTARAIPAAAQTVRTSRSRAGSPPPYRRPAAVRMPAERQGHHDDHDGLQHLDDQHGERLGRDQAAARQRGGAQPLEHPVPALEPGGDRLAGEGGGHHG